MGLQDFKEQIEAHPSTPLDGSFEIAFFMCVDRGGGSLQSRGPTGRHSAGFELVVTSCIMAVYAEVAQALRYRHLTMPK
jgi:hypothetical protein